MAENHHNSGSKGRVVLVAALVVLVLGVAWGAYRLGSYRAQDQHQLEAAKLQRKLADEKAQLARLKSRMEDEMDALALRLGSLQAHMLRLDAVGERLVKKGKLDPSEFDFNREPPVGGVDGEPPRQLQSIDFSKELERLDRTLKDREHKLQLLEDLLMQRELDEQVRISGQPVKKGWISSVYGYRTDPFTGRKRFHRGIDFAGKKGDEVLAVAAGVVIFSGWENGYGNVVEIRHPDGYITHYAHNSENLVNVGDRVEKGEPIALMGSTGRSSGPHVHFEVRRNGKIINPARFISQG